MGIKKRVITNDQVEQLANELADKTYGQNARQNEEERLTISLNGELYDKIEMIARQRKKLKKPNKNMSAVVREALTQFIKKNNI